MGVAARALAHGEWLHIFPEGRVTPDGKVGPFRQGIGRLVCDAKAAAGGRCGMGQGTGVRLLLDAARSYGACCAHYEPLLSAGALGDCWTDSHSHATTAFMSCTANTIPFVTPDHRGTPQSLDLSTHVLRSFRLIWMLCNNPAGIPSSCPSSTARWRV
jgi:hypothetical protein